MKNTSEISERDLRFYRRLLRNRVFSELLAYFESLAKSNDFKKSDLAARLNKDRGAISRLFAEPSNLTLDTVSDLLVAMDAELAFRIVRAQSPNDSTDEQGAEEFVSWAQAHQGDIRPEMVTSATDDV